MIQEWIDAGCNYQEGIKLYEHYKVNDSFLEKFKIRENAFLRKVMKDDLVKLLEQTNETSQLQYEEDKVDHQTHPMEFYPSELHEVFIDRINTHLEARKLKIELNKLSYGQADVALPIILKIDKLFQQNEKCWTILNHWEDTRQILPYKSNSNFNSLSPTALVRTLQNRESSASKLKKNISRWEAELESYDALKRLKKEDDLLRKKKKYQELLNDISELRNIIYKND